MFTPLCGSSSTFISLLLYINEFLCRVAQVCCAGDQCSVTVTDRLAALFCLHFYILSLRFHFLTYLLLCWAFCNKFISSIYVVCVCCWDEGRSLRRCVFNFLVFLITSWQNWGWEGAEQKNTLTYFYWVQIEFGSGGWGLVSISTHIIVFLFFYFNFNPSHWPLL